MLAALSFAELDAQGATELASIARDQRYVGLVRTTTELADSQGDHAASGCITWKIDRIHRLAIAAAIKLPDLPRSRSC